MANELKHISVGIDLSQAEWEGINTHVFDGQAAGDILYAADGTYLKRLPKGNDGQVLTLASGLPSWAAPPSGIAFCRTQVFTGNPIPATWTDLSLAAVVGAKQALVYLECYHNDASGGIVELWFQEKGAAYGMDASRGTNQAGLVYHCSAYCLTLTNSSGICQWMNGNLDTNRSVTIWVRAFLV